jgi:pimeloyl-ACP methyl ester carboxylesterase
MQRSSPISCLLWCACLSCLPARTAWAAPCTTAAATCTEWVTVAGGPSRVLLYRTYPVDTRNEHITRALIMVHGATRDADNYFRTALAAAFLAGALDDTIVIAPRFAANNAADECRDTLAPNELNWDCGLQSPDSWRSGGAAIGHERITSYDVVDEILRKVARRDVFPNLRTVVVAGHSGGGTFTTRYEMANPIHEKLGVPVTYVAANAAAYVYLEPVRPTATAYPVTAAAPGYMPASRADPFVPFADASTCNAFDTWPYGLQRRTGASAKLTNDQLKTQLLGRPITYLLGELDILPLGTFDGSCPAMAQGPTRLARGLAFGKYVNERYSAAHKTVVVPLCGHNARCMFTAELTLPLIFP